jgi:tRNA-2-methylthio-N6-dimethylallyladenosine synthase
MGSCAGRTLDARKFERYFLLNGFKVAKFPGNSDYILFLACAYKKNIEDTAIKRIRELNRYKKRLIVGGCLKEINTKSLMENFNGESFVTLNNEYVDELFSDFKIKFKDVADANILYPERIFQKIKRVCSFSHNARLSLGFLKRVFIYIKEKSPFSKTYYIRICTGCIDTHCTYCAIWHSVGKLHSKPPETCLEEFDNALKNGYRRVILVGDNVGAYGLDINKALPDLLKKFIAKDGNYEIQLDYLHPMWAIKYKDDLIPIFKSGRIGVVNCPVQSGNNRILKLMNRNHDIYQLKEALSELKKAYPRLKFYTHIIVGFPSETEEEFENTLNMVREIGFESTQIFPFSKNRSISDEYIKQETSEQVIKERLKRAASFFQKCGISYLID